MQDTVAEHRASLFSKDSCQNCHMPWVRGETGTHRRHDFTVQGDTKILASAVVADARRGDDRTVMIMLHADRVGHAFPTGDLFRRLEVRAVALDAKGNIVARAPATVLSRVFAATPTGDGASGGAFDRRQIADTRLPADGSPRDIALRFALPVGGMKVSWQVAYQRMSARMAELFAVDTAAHEVIVATGELPPRSEQ